MITQSDRVREIVKTEYVAKARQRGLRTFTVSARDVLHKAEENPDFPRARTPLICNVLQSKKLLDENSLRIDRIDGPPSRQSRRVVVHYAFRSDAPTSSAAPNDSVRVQPDETPEQRAFRLAEKLRGLMKDEIEAHGGAEGYLRWVRGGDDAA